MTTIPNPVEELKEIRSMMERSSKFLSLSGLAGISAGGVALVGSILAYRILSDEANPPLALLLFFDALIVLFLALALAMFFTTRMAKRKALPIWTSTTKYLLTSLAIPLSTGGIFCLLLWMHSLPQFIPSAMLIFYGLALLNSSKYTLSEVKFLAYSEICVGLLAGWMMKFGLLFWSMGFGVAHIVYGILMYLRYEK